MPLQLLTAQNMEDAFGRRVGEPDINNTRWNAATRLAWFNDAQNEIVEETRCLEEDFTTGVSAFVNSCDEVIAFPNNLYSDGIIEIYWVNSDGGLTRLVEIHPKFNTIENLTEGTPTQFFSIGNNIHLMPRPDADGTVRIIGERMPDELINTTDQSLIMPAFRDTIVLYAVAQAWLEDDEYNKYDRTQQLYQLRKRRLKKTSQARRSKTLSPRFRFGRGLRRGTGASIDGHRL